MTKRHFLVLGRVAALIVVATGVGAYVGVLVSDDSGTRQADVASRGAVVMPFDLDKTTHVFRKTETGGIETVTVNDASDRVDQAPLIRAHLEKESQLFSTGDFSDPVAIHGAEMLGVAELASAGDRLTIDYRELSAGASLIYSSADSAVIEAVHAWFDAQVSDHARHASQ